jgi:hypothetical protein
MLVLLLLGFFYRVHSLSIMVTSLHKDEAANGLDALSQLERPRLVPFFPNNFGRESGWIYWITPFVWAFGASPLALRIATLFISVLTLAAIARLAHRLLGPEGAFWSLGIATFFYWLVHLHHLAFRANLYLFLGTMTAAWLLEAHRTNRYRDWLTTGLGLGLLIYTYFASGAWIVYIGLFLLVLVGFDGKRRLGAGLGIMLSGILMLPMVVYGTRHFALFFRRPRHVAATDLGYNLNRWLRAWFLEGDTNLQFNVPGRPILGPWLGVLLVFGIIGLCLLQEHRGYLLGFVGWGLFAWIPSLLSDGAPHFLRASGFAVAITILLGAGARTLEVGLKRVMGRTSWIAGLVPGLILIPPAYDAFVDFHHGWVEHRDTYFLMERHVNTGINYVRDNAPRDQHVYISPFEPTHAVIAYRQADLLPRPVGTFDSHQCLVIPDSVANYVSLTIFEPGLHRALSAWGRTSFSHQEANYDSVRPRYSVLSVEPDRERLALIPGTSAAFGDIVQVGALERLPETLRAGDRLSLTLGIRPLQTPDVALSIFLHLYGDPTPYEGGEMFGQADSQICVSHPAVVWRTDETIIQPFVMEVPVDLEPGRYTVAIGVYVFPNGARLPIETEGLTHPDYYALHEFSVVE